MEALQQPSNLVLCGPMGARQVVDARSKNFQGSGVLFRLPRVGAWQGEVALMEFYNVAEVFEVNTIAVWPRWSYGDKTGHVIRIHGLAIPERGTLQQDLARCKLRLLIYGCPVQLGQVYDVSNGILHCDVNYSGNNLTYHMYEYATPEILLKHEENLIHPAATVLNLEGSLQ
jgi:hypothetical protein